MKKMVMVIFGFLLLTSTIQARSVTTEEKITGLYVAFFNRAPDNAGLQGWKLVGLTTIVHKEILKK